MPWVQFGYVFFVAKSYPRDDLAGDMVRLLQYLYLNHSLISVDMGIWLQTVDEISRTEIIAIYPTIKLIR